VGKLTPPSLLLVSLRAKADDAAAAELQAEPAADEVNREDGVAPEFETETEPVADKHAGDDSRDEDDIDRERWLN